MNSMSYVEAFIVALEALEQNSQIILANINHSLMVSYYNRKKKNVLLNQRAVQQPSERTPEGTTPIKCPPSLPKASTIAHLVCSAANISNWSDDAPSRNGARQNTWPSSSKDSTEDSRGGLAPDKLSPSFLQVNYSSVASDGERVAHRAGEDSLGDDGYSTVDMDPSGCSKNGVHRTPSVKRSKVALRDGSLSGSKRVSASEDWQGKLDQASATVNGSHWNPHSAGPSPFLLEFLSKSKRDCARRRSADSSLKDASLSRSVNIPSSLGPRNRGPTASLAHEESPPKEPPRLRTLSSNASEKSQTNPSYAPQNYEMKRGNSSDSNLGNQASGVRTHSRSRSDGTQSLRMFVPSQPFHLMAGKLEFSNPKLSDKSFSFDSISSRGTWKPFMEDGGQSIKAEADGFFPCPEPGQNLIDFLSSDQFSKASAQLDRENAHFSVAEAVLGAIEQMNFRSSDGRMAKPPRCDESEEDFVQNRTRERNRRKIRMRRAKTAPIETSDDDPATTDYSMMGSPNVSFSSESDVSQSGTEVKESDGEPLSSSDEVEMASSSDPMAAENVAISLLRHYNKKLLPKASELQWLVSEQEVPQKLLPIPKSVALSPDETESSEGKTLLRGTSDWAPPRPQLILTLHVSKKRTAHLISQKWRCAGCGLKVSEKLSRHFRLCHYLGRYFCTTCHVNKKAIIPAKVLHKWDFKKYCVSNFSSELLARMSSDPLFNVGALNPRLYRQSRCLQQAHVYRVQLFHARVYITKCSRAFREKSLLEEVPLHWSTEPHVYSLVDLIAAKENSFVHQLKHLTMSCINHISCCEVCLGQGFICEICRQGGPIFPYQLDAVTQCTKCRACYHFLCFSPVNSCIRCRRRERREKEEEQRNGRD